MVGLGGNVDTGAMIEAYVDQPLPLVGAATGDGLPGTGFTYEWQGLSGDGSVVFSSPESARTTAVFSKPGYYDVRLVAHDGQYGNSAWRRVNVRAGSGNTAPMVATAARTVVAGHPVKLSALVADDGLPNNTLTVTWSGGGENVLISDVHALEPTVTFRNPGLAIMYLDASDGELESTGARIDFQVVAPPAEGNQSPVVSAGDDQTVATGADVTLAGSVTDDGYPEFRTTQQWTQVSGPAQAAFSDPTWVSPTATFPTAGTYVLRLTATDGAASSNDTVTIMVSGTGNHAPAITTSKPASLACTLNTAGTVQLAATDADTGDTLSWSVATPPAHGTASASAAGLTRYTPATGYVGADSFVVRVSDGHGGTDSITINATVTTTKPQVTAVTATPAFATTVGSPVTLSATVVPGTGHSIDHVAFSLGGTSLGNATYNSGTGKWTLPWTASALGRQTITATAYGNDAQTATGTVTVVVGTAGTYGNGGSPWLAGSGTLRIEAESYDEGGEGVAYHDTDARQGTSTVRSGGSSNEVDIVELATGNDASAQIVGYIDAGEWLRYTVTVPTTERYTVRLRVANGSGATSAGAVSLRWKGAVVAGPLSVPATGGWDAYTTLEVTGVTLAAGTDLLQLSCNTDGFDCNWIELIPELTKTPATVTLGGLTQTYNGSARPVTVTTVPSGLAVNVTYSGSATAPVNAGLYSVVATVADASYTGSASGTLSVAKASSTITWTAPAGIVYGTALSSTQLNATASVPGTFTYTPAAGTVLHAGSGQTLQATFTPTDTANYATATKTVTLSVAKATLVAQADNQQRAPGTANPTLGISYTGFVNGDTVEDLDTLPTASTTATTASAAGQYPITLSGGSDADYAFTLRDGMLTVLGIDAPQYARAPQPATVAAGGRAVFGVTVTSARTLTYQWQVSTDGGTTWSDVADGQGYSGATSDELAFTARPEMRGRQFRCVVSDGVNPAIASAAAPLTVPWSQFAALSARAAAGTGEQTLTLGFVFAGGGKPAMVRGVGPGLLDGDPTLAGHELGDPQLKLFEMQSGAFALLTSNDNWGGASTLSQKFAELGQGALARDSKDAALYLETLGQRVYTAQISGVTGSGVALAEAYDADFADKSKRLTALSVRNQVGTGSEVLIAGFVVSGDAPKRVIVRGVGPGLAKDVAAYLADPQLLVHRLKADRSGWDLVGSNDNWDGTAATAALFESVSMGALDAGSKDAALVLELEPGIYTAQISGVGDTTGVALAEIYEAP